MKILTLLGFLVLLTTSPLTNCIPGKFNAVPIPLYHPKPVGGSNFGLLALAVIVFSILLRPSPTKQPPPKSTNVSTIRLFTTSVNITECPSGYTLNETDCGRFCYRLEPQICRSFANARTACQAEGADLLEPDVCTYPLFRGLAIRALGTCQNYWVGAFRTLPAANYVTVRGAALPDNFQFWGNNQPSRTANATAGTEQACVQINKGFRHLLNDDFCTDTVGYICQKFL